MVPAGLNIHLSPPQAEVLALLDVLDVTMPKVEERLAMIRSGTTEQVWHELMRKHIPEPYRSVLLDRAQAGRTKNVDDAVTLEMIATTRCSKVYCSWDWDSGNPAAIKFLTTDDGNREFDILHQLDSISESSGGITPRLMFAKHKIDSEELNYIGTQYCDGLTEADLLMARQTPSPGYAAHALFAEADLLYKLHERDIMHLDMKPGNMLLSIRDNVRRLCDMGFARRTSGAQPEENGLVSGTPAYMPPEQYRGKNFVGLASDIYALGLTAFELITGKPPFNIALDYLDLMEAKKKGVPTHMRELLARHAPMEVATCVLDALETDEGKRPNAATMRYVFLRWHLFLNKHMLPKDKADDIQGIMDYMVKLSAKERVSPFGIDVSESAEDPLQDYRRGRATVKLDPAKIVEAQNQKFGIHKSNIQYSLPDDRKNYDQPTGVIPALAH